MKADLLAFCVYVVAFVVFNIYVAIQLDEIDKLKR